jgi:two-component system response regulator AlgR
LSVRVLLVDDEPLARSGLAALCARSGLAEVVGEAGDAQAALALVDTLRPDALLLDIGMPGLSGLDLAARLAELRRPPAVVLVTAYDHFATEAFDLAVVDYVLKPVEAPRLQRALERLASRVGAPATPAVEIWVPHRGGMARVAVDDIVRLDAERDYVRLQAEGTNYLLRQPLSALATRLDPDRFLRVHRSVVLRRDQIEGLRHLGSGAWACVSPDGRLTRIGRSHLAGVRQRLGMVEA